VVVHTALPDALTAAVEAVLRPTGLDHAPHGDTDPVGAAERAAGDPDAVALIGPFRSADVAEAVEATAPRRLPLLAPVATWAGVTRDDEPGCGDEYARHDGTIFRLVARDTVVAERIATRVQAAGHRAHVIAGDHGYGWQLDGQLQLAASRAPRTRPSPT
jgi:ABC-type branched-subunit amino acid transport system substrate-binding protein